MTVVFVADEGVADSGFNVTYQAVSVLGSEFSYFNITFFFFAFAFYKPLLHPFYF